MSYPGKAFNINFAQKVNGEKQLSFSLYDGFYNKGRKEKNYLVDFLFNEVIIKLWYKNKWYDFILKDISESHSQGRLVFNYECDYLPINELSKNGWSISFSQEKNNCTEDIATFTNEILDGTDWVYDQAAEDVDLTEYSEEVLFQAKLTADVMIDGDTASNRLPVLVSGITNIVANSGTIVYIPFSEKNKADIVQIIVPDTNDFSTLVNNKITGTNYKISRSLLSNYGYASTTSIYYGDKVIESYVTEWQEDLGLWVRKYSDGWYGFDTQEFTISSDTLRPDIDAGLRNVTYYFQRNDDGTVKQARVIGGDAAPTSSIIAQPYQLYLQSKIEGTTFTEVVWYCSNVASNGATTWVKSDIAPYQYEVGQLVPLYYRGSTPPTLTSVLSTEKIRTLIEERSNRFNLIQKVAEVFEVWAHFEYEHDEDGRITGKKLYYSNGVGQQSGIGFYYGKNLTGISRQLVSDSISTKLYVEKVDSSGAENGICSIQDATDNIAGESFLINLDYYVQKGLIDCNELLNDLYGTSSTDLSYLTKLGEQNQLYSQITQQIYGKGGLDNYLSIDIDSKIQYYETAVQTYDEIIENNRMLLNDGQISAAEADISGWTAKKQAAQAQLDSWYESKASAQAKRDELESQLEVITTTKQNLHKQFYNKYSHYLQEGSWSDQNYFQPDSYYYDAQKVLYESSKPSISYSINVLNIENTIHHSLSSTSKIIYELGDIGYIVDEEFFGSSRHEEIIISELQDQLDNQSNTKIIVQNYRTQFEDLFQRTTATVQSYQLNKNIYARAQAINTSNEINFDTLQNSFLNNSFILSESKNNDVIIDKNGIEVSDPTDLRLRVRIVAGGIMLSEDGGKNWTTGIRGSGINANMIKTGRLDTEQVYITNSNYPTFSWNKYGLTAYKFTDSSYDYGTFVRMDQYGFYFIDGGAYTLENPYAPESIEDVKSKSKLNLTWDGFAIKTNNGSVSISSNNDIQVLDSSGAERIKLGMLIQGENPSTSTYGMRIKDGAGATVLQTTSDGNLSLTGYLYLGENIDNPTVYLSGKSEAETNESTGYLGQNRRIVVQKAPDNPTFVVYESGDVYLKGGISADTGKIGGFTIDEENITSDFVTLSPSYISINNGSFLITKTDYSIAPGGEVTETVTKMFEATSDGVINAKNLNVDNGTFNGVINATGGVFNGTVNANGGNFTNINAISGNISGPMILGPKIPYLIYQEVVSAPADNEFVAKFTLDSSVSVANFDDLKSRILNKPFITQDSDLVYVVKLKEITETTVLVGGVETSAFQIKFGLLYSPSNNLDETFTGTFMISGVTYYLGDQNIVLDGDKGNIFTTGFSESGSGVNINGGNSIQINDGLLGKDTLFVEEGKVFVKGLLNVGAQDFSQDSNTTGILINGNQGYIASYNYLNNAGGAGWIVNQDGSAVFENVTVRGRIESSAFIEKSIQAMGGQLIVRSSFTATKEENNTYANQNGAIIVTVITEDNAVNGNYYYIRESEKDFYFKVTNIANNTITLELKKELGNGTELTEEITKKLKTFVNIGKVEINEDESAPVSIAITAGEGYALGNPNSITMYDQQIIDGKLVNNNHLILGKLPDTISTIYDYEISGYGLYADNVYLNGSMISAATKKISEDSSGNPINGTITSGIDTRGITYEGAPVNEGKIILWGGRLNKERPTFYVTEEGYLYARDGYFSGEIHSPLIYAAHIRGEQSERGTGLDDEVENNSGALYIEDDGAESGIIFRKKTESGYLTKAKLSTKEFYFYSPLVVANESKEMFGYFSANNKVVFGNSYASYSFDRDNKILNSWIIKDNSIKFAQSTYDSIYDIDALDSSYLNMTNNSLAEFAYQNNELVLSVSKKENWKFQELFTYSNTKLQVNDNLILADGREGQIKARYAIVKNSSDEVIGYDVFVE